MALVPRSRANRPLLEQQVLPEVEPQLKAGALQGAAERAIQREQGRLEQQSLLLVVGARQEMERLSPLEQP
jgi:hypothetical protein